jgi:PAS domain S-box-containing protein
VHQAGPPTFDWRELRRWGIPESRLPAGSTVLFRELSVWERDRWAIVAGATALFAQTVLITALLVNRVKRQKAEQSLRESEGRFRVLANSAPVMIRMSSADALSRDFNLPWLTFTGRSLTDEQENGWMEGVHPNDVSACVQASRRAFEQRAPYRMEYRLRRFDGEYRWILDSGEPRFTPDGSFAGHIGSAIDVTDLKNARAALSNLNGRLIQAQEQERSRVARELHDDVCQRMAVLALDLQRLGDEFPEAHGHVRRQLLDLYADLASLERDINSISHRLHSSKLEFLGLAAAAGAFCREIAAHHEVNVEFVHEDVPAQLREDVAINLFRVLQEALSNAVKHSGASLYRVSLRRSDNELQLDVVDDGCGFDVATAMATSGLGLVSMQERLRLVNGEAVIESRPGAGTTVRASAPLQPRVAAGVASTGTWR